MPELHFFVTLDRQTMFLETQRRLVFPDASETAQGAYYPLRLQADGRYRIGAPQIYFQDEASLL